VIAATVVAAALLIRAAIELVDRDLERVAQSPAGIASSE
jgi:hypothetical protein